MAPLAIDRHDRLVRKSERALTLLTVLTAVEVLRRSPRWLLIAAGLAVYVLVQILLAYIVWMEVMLASVIAWQLARGAVQGWQGTPRA
jgi:hypothetical protein